MWPGVRLHETEWEAGTWLSAQLSAHRLRRQQLDRGRHAGEEAAAPAPDAGPRGLPESPEEQVPVRLWPHHRLSPSWPLPPTPSLLEIPPPPPPGTEGRPKRPSLSLPSLLGGQGGQQKGGDPSPQQLRRNSGTTGTSGFGHQGLCAQWPWGQKGFWNRGARQILSTRGRGGQTTSGRC